MASSSQVDKVVIGFMFSLGGRVRRKVDSVVFSRPAGGRARSNVDTLDRARDGLRCVAARESDACDVVALLPDLFFPSRDHDPVFDALSAALNLVVPMICKDEFKCDVGLDFSCHRMLARWICLIFGNRRVSPPVSIILPI